MSHARAENNAEGVRIGRSIRYECNQIAKIIADARGMV